MSVQVPKGYKQTEVGVIPEDWQIQSIGFFDPFVTSGSRGWADYYSEYGALFVRITNLQRSSIYLNLDSVKFVTLPSGSSEGVRTKLKKNDVLISITADIGISGFVDKRIPEDSYINQHISLVRFDEKLVDSKYVSYFLASEVSQKRFKSLTDAGAKAGLNLNTVKQIPLLLPPTTEEQQAIAEALSDADALIESLEQLIAKKRQIKQGAMQELLTGQRRLPGFSGEWKVKRLEAIADIDPEQLSSKTLPEYAFKYISLEDVDFGSLVSHSQQVFSSAPSRARRKLRKNDILVSTVRPNLKSHLWFQNDGVDWVCSTGFSVIRCHTGVANPGYVFSHLFAENINKQIYALLTGSNYPAINSSDVRQLEIPLPEFDEQVAISEILNDLDLEVVALQSLLDKARHIKQSMMQELLTGRIRLI